MSGHLSIMFLNKVVLALFLILVVSMIQLSVGKIMIMEGVIWLQMCISTIIKTFNLFRTTSREEPEVLPIHKSSPRFYFCYFSNSIFNHFSSLSNSLITQPSTCGGEYQHLLIFIILALSVNIGQNVNTPRNKFLRLKFTNVQNRILCDSSSISNIMKVNFFLLFNRCSNHYIKYYIEYKFL
jgi:hypothetical protein